MEEKEPARRVRTLLSIDCGVCSAPAPDHKHFGGKHHLLKEFWATFGLFWRCYGEGNFLLR